MRAENIAECTSASAAPAPLDDADGLLVADGTGTLLTLNRTASTLLGIAVPRSGAKLQDLLAIAGLDAAPPAHDHPVARGLRGEHVAGQPILLRGADGDDRWVHLDVTPTIGENGAVALVLIAVRPASGGREPGHGEGKERARRLAELDAIYASAPVGLCFMDTELRFVSVNKRMAALSGVPVAAHVGRRLADIAPRLNACLEPHYRRVLDSGHAALDLEVRVPDDGADGAHCWLLVSQYPVKDGAGRVLGINTVMSDITSRKRAEQERHKLLRREQEARRELQAALQQLRHREEAARFLAEASASLSSSLNYQETLSNLARLAVPRFADWCAVDIREENGELQRLAAVHSNPDRVPFAFELVRWHAADPDALHGPYYVLRTGRSELVPDTLAASNPPVEHAQTLHECGLRSYMSVPLVARGRTLGVITFVSGESGRRYNKEHLALAEELAARAALAVDNARLYRVAQSELAERERAEQALRENEARLRFTLTAAQVGTWEWDFATRRVSWCPNLEAMHGLGPGEFGGTFRDFLRDVHRADRRRVLQRLRRALTSDEDYHIEYRYSHRSGWAEAKGRAIRDAWGVAVGMTGVCMDVSARKRAEEALQEVNQRWRRVLESIGDAFLSFDQDWRGTYANGAAASLLGRSRETLMGNVLWEVCPELTNSPLGAAFRRAMVDHETVGFEAFYPPLDAWLECRCYPSEDGLSVFLTDTTARRRAEIARRESEERLELALDGSNAGFWDMAFDRHRPGVVPDQCYLSPRQKKLIGYEPHEFPNSYSAWVRRVHPDDQERMQNAIRAHFAGETAFFESEYRVQHRDGGVRWLLARGNINRDEQGVPTRWTGINWDITERKRAEEERSRLAAMVESSYDAIIGKSPEGIITSWNRGAERVYGYQAKEVIGQSIGLLLPPGRQDEVPGILEGLRAGHQIEEFETIRVRKDGQQIDVALMVSPIFNGNGEVVGASTISRDITERKRTEQALRISEERFRTALKGSPIIVFNQDTALRYTWVQGPAAPFPVEQLLGKCDADIVENREDARTLERLKRRVLQTGTGVRQEVRMTVSGSEWFLDLTIEPQRDPDGSVVGITCAAVDITDHTRLQAKLLQQAEQLAEADRRKDEFLAMLAHELRNPLAPIHSAVQVLKRQPAAVAGELEWGVGVIDRQVEHMKRLVDDLLDVARITRGRIRLQKTPVSAAEVVDRATESVAPLIRGRRHELLTTLPAEPVWLDADATRLVQVVANLLNNAAKYTDPGGRIELRVERVAERAIVIVEDNGIGIRGDFLPRIFEPFLQTERPLDRSLGGLGMGLPLVRRLVEMHGGHVEASSAGPGLGSRFVVSLPALPASYRPPAMQVQDAPSAPYAGRRVLVVEDNDDVAKSFAMLLSTLGHTVELAADGEAALAAARRILPEVVFLDIGLPGMSGYEVARLLKQEHGRGGMMIVALTGYGDTGRRAEAAGFDHYLLKPADVNRIETLLADLNG